MFGRKKKDAQAEEPVTIPDREGAKNRPTPSRREREAARRQPLVPQDRKAAAKAARGHQRDEREKQRAALVSGDERNMGPRDAGPVRRYVRDAVDSRINMGEYFLFIALFSILLVLGPQLLLDLGTESGLRLQAQLQLITTAVLWGMIILVILDAYRLSRMLRQGLKARFGADFETKGHVSYGVSRALQFRRWRLPRPAIKRGEKPRPS